MNWKNVLLKALLPRQFLENLAPNMGLEPKDVRGKQGKQGVRMSLDNGTVKVVVQQGGLGAYTVFIYKNNQMEDNFKNFDLSKLVNPANEKIMELR
tara:strand:+ start:481 stop:768 length:288 start_codon:yes stop_codon:yes gene_type:complete